MGLDLLFNTEDRSSLYEAILEGKTVVMNSVLHDLYRSKTLLANPNTTTASFRYYTGLDACGMCVGRARECQCSKPNSIRRYQKNMGTLADLLRSARQAMGVSRANDQDENPMQNRFFWLTMHRGPPTEKYRLHPSTGKLGLLHDLLWEVEDIAARIMTNAGAFHLDFRPHLTTAPTVWWDDHVHYGKRENSTFIHHSVQILLNHVCANV